MKVSFLDNKEQSKTQWEKPATLSGASRAIDQLCESAGLVQPSGAEIFESDVAIQRCAVQAGERSEVAIEYHLVLLWEAQVAECEPPTASGHYRRYRKYPNTISTVVPGLFPARRRLTPHTAIVCALNPEFVTRLERELDRLPKGSLHELTGEDDFVLRNIMRLLIKEADDGGPSGKLYGESLATALATRLLYLGKSAKRPELEKISVLPRGALRKVIDRMRSGIHGDPDLKTLAAGPQDFGCGGRVQPISLFADVSCRHRHNASSISARPEIGEGQGTARHEKDSINRHRGCLRLLQPLAYVNGLPQPLWRNTKSLCTRVKEEVTVPSEKIIL